MSLNSQIKSIEKRAAKCDSEKFDIVGKGFKEAESQAFPGKLHALLRLVALENDDHNRKNNASSTEPFPAKGRSEKVSDKKGGFVKVDGEFKLKKYPGYFRLSDVSKSPKKSRSTRSARPPLRKKKKATVYEDEESEQPIENKESDDETKESDDDTKESDDEDEEPKKYTLDMGKEGMLAMVAAFRMMLWEVYNATAEGTLPSSKNDIRKFLDESVSGEFDCNIWQFIAFVAENSSLAYRDNLFGIDTLVYEVVKDYCGNSNIAIHVGETFAKFAKVVAIHASNMFWHCKTLKRLNEKIFSIFRNLEIGVEGQPTISSGVLDKLVAFVKLSNEHDGLRRAKSKLLKEKKKAEEGETTTKSPKAAKPALKNSTGAKAKAAKAKAKAAKAKKAKAAKAKAAAEASDPEPSENEDELSD